MYKVEPTNRGNIGNVSCENVAEEKSIIKTLTNGFLNQFKKPHKRIRDETSSISSDSSIQTSKKMRVATIGNKVKNSWMVDHANHGSYLQGSLPQVSFQQGFESSEESRRKEIQTDKKLNLEQLQKEMKQIELEGEAKVDSINQEKKEELHKLDEEKFKKLREDETSSRNNYNSDIIRLKKEVKEKQTQIRSQHEDNMDRLKSNEKMFRN